MRWAQSGAPRCAKCGTPVRPGMNDPCECLPDEEARTRELEAEGLTRSDAQGCVEAEALAGVLELIPWPEAGPRASWWIVERRSTGLTPIHGPYGKKAQAEPRFRELKEARAAGELDVCPNCGQWVHHTGGDCMNDCKARGFAPKGDK